MGSVVIQNKGLEFGQFTVSFKRAPEHHLNLNFGKILSNIHAQIKITGAYKIYYYYHYFCFNSPNKKPFAQFFFWTFHLDLKGVTRLLITLIQYIYWKICIKTQTEWPWKRTREFKNRKKSSQWKHRMEDPIKNAY